jgi:hypothetical protein
VIRALLVFAANQTAALAVVLATFWWRTRRRRTVAEVARITAELPLPRRDLTPPSPLDLPGIGATQELAAVPLRMPRLRFTRTVTAVLAEPTPIFDALEREFADLIAARVRALTTPTAAFWAIVAASDWTCEHCTAGDHILCPGCECGCTLVGLEVDMAVAT